MRGERSAADHLGETRADNIVLEANLDVMLTAEFADELLERWEKFGEAWAELDFAAQLAELAVRETLHGA